MQLYSFLLRLMRLHFYGSPSNKQACMASPPLMYACCLQVALGDGGVASAMRPGKAYVDMSTVDEATSQRIAEAGEWGVGWGRHGRSMVGRGLSARGHDTRAWYSTGAAELQHRHSAAHILVHYRGW